MENLIKDIMQVFWVKEDTAKEFIDILFQIVRVSDKAYERGKRDAQANIVQCEDCKWRRNQNGTMAWIPCRALVTPDDFYCKYAERKEQ